MSHVASMCCLQPFCSDGAGIHSLQHVGLYCSPLAWAAGGKPLQAALNLPNRLSGWGQLGATLSLGYELITCPCAAGEDSAPYSGIDLGTVNSVCSPLGWTAARPHGFQELSPAFLTRWGQKTLCTVGGVVTLLLAWGWADWPRGLANSSCEDLNQAEPYLSKFSGQSVP